MHDQTSKPPDSGRQIVYSAGMGDPLSTILGRTGVVGTVFSRAELHAPWSVHTRGGGTDEDGPRAAIFHVIVRGAGYVRVHGALTPWRSGDVILLPHGDAHTLSSSPDVDDVHISDLPLQRTPEGLDCILSPGDGPLTSILCGSLHFSPEADELLRPHLPPLLHLSGDGAAGAWLDATLRFLGAETASPAPGTDAVVARLAEVVLVQALRGWIRDAPAAESGWLGALDDPQLSRVLGIMHEEPAEAWTATSLARRAGMSRSALYTRFTEALGEPPATYLTRWRMQLARRSLRDGTPLIDVAASVGYQSAASFSRAFKRWAGCSPSAYARATRRAERTHASSHRTG